MFPASLCFTSVSLFTGAGGLDTGLCRVGAFDLLACVELVEPFCETLRTNRDAGRLGTRATQVIQADIASLNPEDLMDSLGLAPGELDLLIGGPPCQSFSTAGRRQTIADPRGTLAWDFLRFVDVLRPKFFLMENVRGLLSAALRHRPIAARPERGGPPLHAEEMPGSVMSLWAADASCVGGEAYRVDCFEVNAVNYGAPQLRERVLFIGNRLGHLTAFPPPTHGPVDPATGQPPAGLAPFTTLGDALTGFHEDDQVLMDFSPRKKRYLAMVPPGGNWRALPPQVAQESMGRAYLAKGGRSGWWRRLSWDLPCPTLVTMPNHASTSMCHPEDVRALSVGECARVQGFPDGWVFAGTPEQQYAQVGNAVPTRLGTVAGEVIATHLAAAAGGAAETAGHEPGALPSFRRVYLKSHVRTRQWYRNGQAYVWDGLGGSAHYGGATRSERNRAAEPPGPAVRTT
ncbi:MAG TPA: DNA cytosine methyltransferase [Streptosporangiaceae bacterium]|nr:DNA cytosine methyltransferase [Streptosporangiaceae bacterium]